MHNKGDSVRKVFLSYAVQVGVLWGLLEGYTYFRGNALKDFLGGYWVLIYIFPLISSAYIWFYDNKSENSQEFNDKLTDSSRTISDSIIAHNIQGDAIIDRSTNVLPDLRPARLEIVAIDATWGRSLDLDFKLRNPSPEVVFASHIEINIHDFRLMNDRRIRTGPVKLSSTYNAVLPIKKGTVIVPISQEIKPNGVDRFLLRMVADRNDSLGASIFLFSFVIVYNEDKKKVRSHKYVADIPGRTRQGMAYQAPLNSLPKDDLIAMRKDLESIVKFIDDNKQLGISVTTSYEEFYSDAQNSIKTFDKLLKEK